MRAYPLYAILYLYGRMSCTYTRMHICMYAYTCAYKCTHVREFLHSHIHTCMHHKNVPYLCVCIQVSLFVYIFQHTYIHTYIHTYTKTHTNATHYVQYIHIYTHTYIHTHTAAKQRSLPTVRAHQLSQHRLICNSRSTPKPPSATHLGSFVPKRPPHV